MVKIESICNCCLRGREGGRREGVAKKVTTHLITYTAPAFMALLLIASEMAPMRVNLDEKVHSYFNPKRF